MKPSLDRHRFGPWAVVTGASSGIGAAFARHLAVSGLNLVLAARRLPELRTLGDELAASHGIDYRAVGVDLTDDDFLDRLRTATADLDVGTVIGNAGAALPGRFLDLDTDDLLRGVQLKVTANLRLAHHFGRRLTGRGRGGLLLVSSVGGRQGVPYMANNAATEAYVLSLGEALHAEFAGHGVHVTVLLPGPTDTPALAGMGIDPTALPIRPMSADRCAAEGLAALAANRATHIAGRINRIQAHLLPRPMATRVMGATIGRTFAAGSPTGATA
ncbi:SDR family NAD(P)-dependent oxidoreductase [Micromonospora sp. NPDC047707]|uniref:SDR family NAD(P)-dependent oxidoreductase n=1 Tax=Micromonospora sp. NPDC047707 TaxID=3154498 RepID=UPI0034541648